MSKKIAVQFRKSARTRHAYERLRQCKSCGNYTALWTDHCLQCGETGQLRTLNEIAQSIHRRNTVRDAMIVFSISLAAFFLAETFAQMAIAIVAGIAFVAGYIFLSRRYALAVESRLLHQMLVTENRAIRDGLLLDIEDAAGDLKADEHKAAYEKLREIGYLITGNQVKVLKLMCLSHFILRSDMDLELSALVPTGFEPDFVRYLNEVLKISPQLVKRDTLNYVVKHRSSIEASEGGRETLILAAGAALRVKSYVVQYQHLIADFVEELPRERLLRLCKLLQGSHEEAPELYDKARDTVKLKHDFDPEFQGLV
ncbi:hypothetical protein DVH26_33240 [Paenibacillus sp. H1-7]|uniref:hypothetical protein n=1 Tax=Paenibacillus sp. H1-7 TaxID=2282849 RepID=UPI001EF7E623|nr:hypothetical protein [Paenibacillus sp. H1-7]ULL18877.1 hypothetical protein DVH26_33240 [Paenibacillus sp. H1-7]